MKYQGDSSGPQGWFGKVDTRGCNKFSFINCTYDKERQIHVNNDDNTVWGNDDASYNTDDKYNFQFDPTVSLRGRWFGQHDAKAGVQLKLTYRKQFLHRPGIVRYVDQGGGAGEAGLCDPEGDTAGCNTRSFLSDRRVRSLGIFPGVFIQDKWRPLRWLTIVPGLRFDYGEARLTDGSLYTGVYGFGPRFGVVIDLTRDQKTILSANYGRSSEVQEIGNASDWDLTYQGNQITESFNRPTGQWLTQTTTGVNRLNKHPTTSHSDDVTATLRREIFRNTLAEVEYTWRQAQNQPEKTEINRLWNITGYRVLGYADGIAHTIFYYDNPDRTIRTYQGLTLSVESQPTRNFYVLGFYTLSWLYGTIDSASQNTGNLDIPRNDKYLMGYLSEDHRHQFHVSALYKWRGLAVGTIFEYLSGAPGIGKKGMNQARGGSPNYLSPRGTEPGNCSGSSVAPNSPATTACGNDINKVSEFRVPDTFQLDLHVEYDFARLIRQHVILSADIFNLFGTRPATTFGTENDTKAATFAQVGNRLGNSAFASAQDTSSEPPEPVRANETTQPSAILLDNGFATMATGYWQFSVEEVAYATCCRPASRGWVRSVCGVAAVGRLFAADTRATGHRRARSESSRREPGQRFDLAQ